MSEKRFTPFDEGIRLVQKPSDLDEYDDDPDVLRAELSCGHVTDPMSLTDCCKAQLDEGQSELQCPLCNKEWQYDEVRKLSKLSIDEQNQFEESLGTNTVKKLLDFKDCPGCGTLIERVETSNLCVQCLLCTKKNRRIFEFCWQCLREWKGPRPRADQCGNVGCNIKDQDVLRDCTMIILKSVQNVQCPVIRACPFCGVLIEHSGMGCKIMTCLQCNNVFCFVCLKPSQKCLKTTTEFMLCKSGVAPRQTKIQ